MIIGITGLSYDSGDRRSIAGSGKDTIAEQLVKKHRFASIALADPMKRFCQEVFDFTDDQLWGPSEHRNQEDVRFERHAYNPKFSTNQDGVPGMYFDTDDGRRFEPQYLTPRYALQRLGTEWGRDCYPDLWVNYCLRVAKGLLKNKYCYDQKRGGGHEWAVRTSSLVIAKGVVIPDLRFINEFERIKEAGGKVWRVKRRVACVPKELGEGHLSERELLELPDSEFDAIFPNEGKYPPPSLAGRCRDGSRVW